MYIRMIYKVVAKVLDGRHKQIKTLEFEYFALAITNSKDILIGVILKHQRLVWLLRSCEKRENASIIFLIITSR